MKKLIILLFLSVFIISCGDENGQLMNCGNGILDVGEDCDDGNITNLDGCSSGCTLELPTEELVPDVVLGLDEIDTFKQVKQSLCSEKNSKSYANLENDININVCIVGFLYEGTNRDRLINRINRDVNNGKKYYDITNSKIKFNIVHIDILDYVVEYEKYVNNKNTPEINETKKFIKDYTTQFYPGECQVIVGFNNTIKTSNGFHAGGIATFPFTTNDVGREHTFLVAHNSPFNVFAHEMGHTIGLLHTHQQDACSDTVYDPYNDETDCNTRLACGAGCQCDGSGNNCKYPPTENVMSYYLTCGRTETTNSFSPCQINMARCFVDKMFIHQNNKENPGKGNKKRCSYSATDTNNQGTLFLLGFLFLFILKKRKEN